MANLEVAKPSKKDFDIVYRFLSVMEALTDNRMYRKADISDWVNWNEDDKDYQVLKTIREEVMDEYDIEDFEDLEREHYIEIVWRYVCWFFNYHPSALGRVVMCADIAMENAFDNSDETDIIKWKPNIDAALDMYNESQKTKE